MWLAALDAAGQAGAGTAAPEPPAETPIPGHVLGRSRVGLNGTWRFMLDAVQRGLRDQYPRYTIPRDEKQMAGGPLIEYDWDEAPTIRVPGDWNTQDPRYLWYEGLAWYRRRVFAPAASPAARHFLYFEGANYVTHVYLNGEKLGEHEGGFTPFAFEVTGRLRPDNSLVVGVSNRKLPDGIPVADADWWNYGGLTRPVWLVATPETYVRDFSLALQPDESAPVIRGWVALDGPARGNARVAVAIPELGARAETRTDASGRATVELRPARLQRWSPETPRLYSVSVQSDGDQIEERIGFRTVAVSGREILVNGRPTFLRGISIHEETIGEASGTGSRTLTPATARALLREAKELGCNFVRLAHYPHSELMTRLADELGLLVWSEIPVYQNDVQYGNAKTLATARRMLAANIVRDRNRASILVWSVANETPLTPERLAFLGTLVADVRRLDPSRLVSAALDRTSGKGLDMIVDDPLGEQIDVLAVNEYVGWYGNATPDQIRQLTWQTPYEKPMIFSEFGADAKAGHHGDRRERWTEEYQRYFYEETLRMADRIPFLRGMSPWILKDFRSPRRYHGLFQEYWNRKGLISENGVRKLAFETLRAYYAGKAPPRSAEPGAPAKPPR
jgi:beta-glucuronidase